MTTITYTEYAAIAKTKGIKPYSVKEWDTMGAMQKRLITVALTKN